VAGAPAAGIVVPGVAAAEPAEFVVAAQAGG